MSMVLDRHELGDALSVSLPLARRAAELVLGVYREGDFQETRKEDDSPLTRADLLAHRFIVEELSRQTPWPVLSEEDPAPDEERRTWPTFWLVDPLDGTKDFINRTGHFTVNIALVDAHAPVVGVMAVPAVGCLYHAVTGQGAFKDGAPLTPAPVPAVPKAARSHFHMHEKTEAFLAQNGITETRAVGSAYKFGLLAEGEVSVYPRWGPTMEWDIAAGHCIAAEAGCRVVDLVTGEEVSYNKPSLVNNPFVAFRKGLSVQVEGVTLDG